MATKKQNHPSSAADQIGGSLLSAMKDELNALPNPGNPQQTVWGSMGEVDQDMVLDRLKRRIRHCLEAGLIEIFADGVPSVRADVDGMNFKGKGIVCSLKIPLSSTHRHELADAAGGQVLVVVTPDIDAYLKSADMIKPDSDQNELDLTPSEEDQRTTTELKDVARQLCEQIDEGDLVDEVDGWNREHLVSYVAYAENKLIVAAEGALGDGPGAE